MLLDETSRRRSAEAAVRRFFVVVTPTYRPCPVPRLELLLDSRDVVQHDADDGPSTFALVGALAVQHDDGGVRHGTRSLTARRRNGHADPGLHGLGWNGRPAVRWRGSD